MILNHDSDLFLVQGNQMPSYMPVLNKQIRAVYEAVLRAIIGENLTGM